MLEYAVPGSYTLAATVSDGQGGSLVRVFPITVTNGSVPPDPDPVADGALPAIDALAMPGQGTAPLAVAFSTQVTTTGTLRPFADATAQDADLSGTAVLVRRRGETYTSLTVTGARAGPRPPRPRPREVLRQRQRRRALPLRHHPGLRGAQRDLAVLHRPTRPVPAGSSTSPSRSGPGPLAVAVVVHDPDNPARRIGCADLRRARPT